MPTALLASAALTAWSWFWTCELPPRSMPHHLVASTWIAREIICWVPEPELRTKYSDGSLYAIDFGSLLLRPNTMCPISALIAVSGDSDFTTNAIGWIGPKYSPIGPPGTTLNVASHEVANTSDAPTSSATGMAGGLPPCVANVHCWLVVPSELNSSALRPAMSLTTRLLASGLNSWL